jgi:carboxypeptidase C (cathepsin A)
MSIFSKALDGLNRHNDRTRIKVIAMNVPHLMAEGKTAEVCVLMNEAMSLIQKLKVYNALGGLDQKTINTLVEINDYLHESDEYSRTPK